MTGFVRCIALSGVVCVLGHSAQGGGLALTDVTASAGLGGWTQVSSPLLYPFGSPMIAGGCVGDFNGDGWQDIFFVAGGHRPDRLFINNADGTFTDQAASWGVDRSHIGAGASAGDYNADGHLDIFVTSYGVVTNGTPFSGPGYHLLYRNNGDGTFTNVAFEAGVNATSLAQPDGFGSTFGDYDMDGDLDLMVVAWRQESGGNTLFRNNGDGTFTNATSEDIVGDLHLHRGFSPSFIDMNGDRAPELLLVGDFMTSRFLVNDGTGKLTDITPTAGTGIDGNGMGSTIGDVNNDGLLDWYVTSILHDTGAAGSVPGTGNMLYMNLGNDQFKEQSADTGCKDGGWGWGARAVDIDHDRDLDLVETNGWRSPIDGSIDPVSEWLDERCYLFQNNGTGSFTDIADLCGLDHAGQGRGLARLDYDNDGDQDILIFSNSEPPRLYRNDLAGPGTNWLRIFLEPDGAPGIPPDGLGSMIRVSANGTTTVHPMAADCAYLSTSEQSVHVGLGHETVVDEVLVTWPNGRRTVLSGVSPNQTLTIGVTCDGDADGDDDVDFNDLLYILFRFGATSADADVDGSGLADFNDLIFTLFRFGACA